MRALHTLLLLCLTIPAPGWLGVGLEDRPGGAVIVEVVPGSPAQAAGLQPGDVFVSIAGAPTADLDSVAARIGAARAGSRIAIVVRRDGAALEVVATLAEPPAADDGEPGPVRSERAGRPPAAPPARAAATPMVEFAEDARAALARARRANLPVLLVFGATWCAACQAQRRALASAELAEALAGVATIWVDTDTEAALTDEFGVRSLPHLFVLDGSGERRATREGYQPPANVAALLGDLGGTAERPAAEGGGDPLTALRAEVAALRKEVAEVRTLLEKLLEKQ
jgi:thiol-disulfide isomerase/thioredoxin